MSAEHSALSTNHWVVNLTGFLMYKQPLQKKHWATLSQVCSLRQAGAMMNLPNINFLTLSCFV